MKVVRLPSEDILSLYLRDLTKKETYMQLSKDFIWEAQVMRLGGDNLRMQGRWEIIIFQVMFVMH